MPITTILINDGRHTVRMAIDQENKTYSAELEPRVPQREVLEAEKDTAIGVANTLATALISTHDLRPQGSRIDEPAGVVQVHMFYIRPETRQCLTNRRELVEELLIACLKRLPYNPEEAFHQTARKAWSMVLATLDLYYDVNLPNNP